MQVLSLPKVFEPDFYRRTYPELAQLTDQAALQHFQDEGIAQGFAGSPGAERGHLLSFALTEESVLEIGPFHAPSVVGENVRYMDVLTTEELHKAVREAGHDTSNVPEIHYVAPNGGFGMVDRKFSTVFSGHCIEHQPDLIRHFQGVSSVLEDGGRYFIACPDKRYCFDHYVPETGISDVLAAYHAKRRLHQQRSFIVQRLHGAHNDADRHWSSDHGPQRYETYKNPKTAIFEDLPGDDAYHDAHAWQFTPSSFFELMTFLYEIGLTDFAIERVYHTRLGTQEFTAVLRKGWHPTGKEPTFIPQTSSETRISGLKREIGNLKNEQSRTRGEIDSLKNEQARAYEEIEQLKGARSRAENEVADLRHHLTSLLSSRSWTVTRPLRKMADYLRRPG